MTGNVHSPSDMRGGGNRTGLFKILFTSSTSKQFYAIKICRIYLFQNITFLVTVKNKLWKWKDFLYVFESTLIVNKAIQTVMVSTSDLLGFYESFLFKCCHKALRFNDSISDFSLTRYFILQELEIGEVNNGEEVFDSNTGTNK